MNRCPAGRDTSSSSSRSQRWNTAPMQHDAMTTTTIVLSATDAYWLPMISSPALQSIPLVRALVKYAPRHDSAWQVTSLCVPRRNTRRTLVPGVECDCTRHGPRLRRAQPSFSFGNDGPLSGCTIAAGVQPQLDRAFLARRPVGKPLAAAKEPAGGRGRASPGQPSTLRSTGRLLRVHLVYCQARKKRAKSGRES
jgi:hypothetical protein